MKKGIGRLGMTVAIATFPYLIALMTYWSSYMDLFEPLQASTPRHWPWKSTQAVLTSALSPLILAASKKGLNSQDLTYLLCSTAVVVFVFIIMFVILGRKTYFRMQVPLGIGRFQVSEKVTPARVIFVFGTCTIALAAAATMYVGQRIQ